MPAPTYGRALAATALAYAVLHHLGALPGGLGAAPQGTRWVDWLDLAVPYLVLAPAALTLHAAHISPLRWAAFAVGAIAYADGHGIHLAANSVANAAPGEVAHLWDETIGHLVWYAGAVIVAAVLARTMARRPRPTSPVAWLLAVAVGATWATNTLGGLPVWLGSLVIIAAVAYGWRHRDGLPSVVLCAGLSSGAVLAVLA